MADDKQEMVGKWTVKVQGWTWEYVFTPDGKVTWRDPLNNEHGVGGWAVAGTVVNMWWIGSATRESWQRPITPKGTKGWYSAPYYTGAYKLIEKQVATGPATGPSFVNPSVANVPSDRYVDQYTDLKYDINYSIPPEKSFAFSSILQLKYGDGVSLELDIEKDFSTAPMSPDAAREAMAKASLGRAGRIFPTVLNFRTVPRLWRARADAFQDQDKEAKAFMGVAVTGVAVALTVPAMPAGAEEAVILSKPVTRRSVPGTKVPPAPIRDNQVAIGTGNGPGTLRAAIQSTSEGVVYIVREIILQGSGTGVLTARATHREMIRRAAQAAQSAGRRQFKMVGKQANPNFVRHADELAQQIGVPGSGTRGMEPTAGFADYEVTLDVAKVLSDF